MTDDLPDGELSIRDALAALGPLRPTQKRLARADIEALITWRMQAQGVEVDQPSRGKRVDALERLAAAMGKAAHLLHGLPAPDSLTMAFFLMGREVPERDEVVAIFRDLATAARQTAREIPGEAGGRGKHVIRQQFGEKALEIFERHSGRRATAAESRRVDTFLKFITYLNSAVGVDAPARKLAEDACRARDEKRGIFSIVTED